MSIIFLLQANLDLVKKRLVERDNFMLDINFYNYEKEVFRYLSNKCDIIHVIDNSKHVSIDYNKVNDFVKDLGKPKYEHWYKENIFTLTR